MITVFAKNPIHYQVGLFKTLHKIKVLSEVVFFGRQGLDELVDPEFNCRVRWDIPLIDGYPSIFIKNFGFGNGFFSKINFGLITKCFHGKHPVLIQSYDNFSNLLALILCKILGRKVFLRAEATLRANDLKFSSFKYFIKKFYLLGFFSLVDVFLSSCSGNRSFLEFYGARKSNIVDFGTAVDNFRFSRFYKQNLDKVNEFKKDLNIDNSKFVLIFPARLTNNKRPKEFIKVIGKSLYKDNLHLLFVGDGPLKEEVIRLCNDFKLSFSITGFVNQSEIMKYYLVSDLLVLISGFDNSPKVVNEALNFGIPIVITERAGTARDLVSDKNGIVLDDDRNETLRIAIEKFLNMRKTEYLNYKYNSLKMSTKWTFETQAKVIKKELKKFGY